MFTRLKTLLGDYPATTFAFFILAGGMVMAGPAAAQSYPNRVVKIIVPFVAGGGTDVMARNIAQKLNEAWSQPVVVENRTGAGGIIGADAVAKSPPDGYTFLLGTTTTAINASLVVKFYIAGSDQRNALIRNHYSAKCGPPRRLETHFRARNTHSKVREGTGQVLNLGFQVSRPDPAVLAPHPGKQQSTGAMNAGILSGAPDS